MNPDQRFSRQRHLYGANGHAIPNSSQPRLTILQLQVAIEEHLHAINALLPSHKLTLIGRWTGDPAKDYDMLMSTDDLALVEIAFDKMKDQPPTIEPGTTPEPSP